jgi:hypothetical protein
MASKIKSVTIVNNQGTQVYSVGSKYNGLLIEKIVDCSMVYPEEFTAIYQGRTKNEDLVFEVINAPIDVVYELIK